MRFICTTRTMNARMRKTVPLHMSAITDATQQYIWDYGLAHVYSFFFMLDDSSTYAAAARLILPCRQEYSQAESVTM